jgi:hypothetical protein
MKHLRIFIAFASDCDRERRIILKMCRSDRTIKKLSLDLGVGLDCADFKDASSDAGRPQSLINVATEKWKPDWFIFLFWRKLGRDAGLGMTGMEEEWSRAIALNQQGRGHPRVSLYFNNAGSDAYEADAFQEEALKRFRTTIFEQHQALAKSFKGASDFREQFHADLSSRLVEIGRGVDSLDFEQEFSEASKGLLSWPRTLTAGDEIQRPELQALLEKVRTMERSTTLILGKPGSGKSALLAGLGDACIKKGFSVLAIKSDQLGKEIHTAEDLRQWLHLSLNTRDAVRKLAARKPVVVLVDQLDALSELVDRQSDRLNVLLDLIQNLSEYQGVHIIASCRDFECRYDIRLSSLNADRTDLALPSWAQVAPILAKAGYDPAVIGATTQDLLRSPWCLKVFLDLAKPGKVFSTLQSLMEELWVQKVLACEGAKDQVELLEFLSRKMSTDEVLWVPSSLGDRWPKALQGLIREDVLSKGPDGLTIGFRHQTFYDFTLARAFANGALSLSRHVRRNQNGLFVRPVLLNGLQYLRDLGSPEYHTQLEALSGQGIRLHIRSLLIEYLGGLKEPDDVEFSLVISRLKSRKEGPRVLASIAGSPGWFSRMSKSPAFLKWLSKPHGEAIHALNVLCLATQSDPVGALDLIERYWLPRRSHDDLTLRVFSYFSVWTARAVKLASTVLERKADGTASLLVDQAAGKYPEFASMLLRAALDGRLRQAQAIVVKLEKKRSLSPEEKLVAGSKLDGRKGSLIKLVEEEEDWYNIEALAEAAPQSFLDHVWPWFLKVIALIAHEEHEFVIGYRDDSATYNEFDGELPQGSIVKALLVAVTQLAQQEPYKFVEFARASWDSDLKIIHRLLARGYRVLVPNRPGVVLEYLLGDPRRLEIGDHADGHRESKALIAALSSRLTGEELKPLEDAVVNFKQYKKIMPDWTPQDRFDRTMWTRAHRLRLLRAFVFESMSEASRALRDQEERALPGVEDLAVRGGFGYVGSRITADQMSKASDEHLLSLFKSLPDKTEGSNPKMRLTEDFSRTGGAWQLARELGTHAKENPERVLALLDSFIPGQEETYAGEALSGLAETHVSTSSLIASIAALNGKGFSSGSFREGAAGALKSRAMKENGLPQNALEILEEWLWRHLEPVLSQHRGKRDNVDRKQGREILFGSSPTWTYPNGRGSILEAIAEGYLQQDPPNYDGWADLIKSRLGREEHPAIWVMTLMRMPPLFNWDRGRATALFDSVIKGSPSVLEYDFALYPIANIMRLCEPKVTAQGWMDMLKSRQSDFSQQAYGEFLFLYHCRYHDSWSRTKFTTLLRTKRSRRTLLGLAHGASHLWKHVHCRVYAAKVIEGLASSKDPLIVRAVTNLFRLTRDELELNPSIRRIILRITQNRKAILESAEDVLELLSPLSGAEPRLVLQVCNALLGAGRDEIRRYGGSSVPESLTNIALTLHRQRKFRAAGLKLFESLLEMNVGEAKAALDVLDRNPVTKAVPYRPRRLRRRKVAALKS